MYCKVKAEAPFPNILFSLSPVTLYHNYVSSLELLKSSWILRTVRHKYRSGQKLGFGPIIIKSLKKGSEHQNDKQYELFYRNITVTATRWFDITALFTSFLTDPCEAGSTGGYIAGSKGALRVKSLVQGQVLTAKAQMPVLWPNTARGTTLLINGLFVTNLL